LQIPKEFIALQINEDKITFYFTLLFVELFESVRERPGGCWIGWERVNGDGGREGVFFSLIKSLFFVFKLIKIFEK